jgi:hypothetical protein
MYKLAQNIQDPPYYELCSIQGIKEFKVPLIFDKPHVDGWEKNILINSIWKLEQLLKNPKPHSIKELHMGIVANIDNKQIANEVAQILPNILVVMSQNRDYISSFKKIGGLPLYIGNYQNAANPNSVFNVIYNLGLHLSEIDEIYQYIDDNRLFVCDSAESKAKLIYIFHHISKPNIVASACRERGTLLPYINYFRGDPNRISHVLKLLDKHYWDEATYLMANFVIPYNSCVDRNALIRKEWTGGNEHVLTDNILSLIKTDDDSNRLVSMIEKGYFKPLKKNEISNMLKHLTQYPNIQTALIHQANFDLSELKRAL